MIEPTSIGIGVAIVIFSSLGATYFAYIESDKLKIKARDALKAKMGLVDDNYLTTMEKILSKKRKGKWLMEPKDRAILIHISRTAYDLEYLFRSSISRIRDKISKAFILGILLGLIAILISVVYDFSLSLAIVIGYGWMLIGYIYFQSGVYQFIPMRKIEGCIEDIAEMDNLNEIMEKVIKTIDSV